MKEQSRAVASTFSLAYWIFLVALSTLLIVVVSDFVALIVWGSFAILLSLGALFYRRRLFLRSSSELVKTGQVVTPYDLRRQHTLLLMLIVLTAVAFFAPLLLSAALDSAVWIGSLLGVIDGWILGLLFYNLFLFRWENKNEGELFILQTWNGNKVTHLGLSFSKRGTTQ